MIEKCTHEEWKSMANDSQGYDPATHELWISFGIKCKSCGFEKEIRKLVAGRAGNGITFKS